MEYIWTKTEKVRGEEYLDVREEVIVVGEYSHLIEKQ